VIGIFKHKNPANFLLLLLFGVLIKLPIFLHPHSVSPTAWDSTFYSALLKYIERLSKNFPSVYPLTVFVLLFLQAITITRFINKNRIINLPSYLPGMAYMLITSLFPEWNYLSAPLIANTFFLLILSGLLNIYNKQNPKGTIYNMGLGMGIALFVFFPAFVFVVWVLIGMLVMRPFRLDEWVLCIVGITTPFYFYAVYLFISSQWNWQHLLPHFSLSFPLVRQSPWLAGSAFLLALPFLAGGYYVQEKLRRMLIQVRLGWSLLLLYLLAAVLVPFTNSSSSFEYWIMCAVPFAAFHACTYLYSTRRIFPQLIFWVTVSYVLAYQYYGPGW